jgi:hypothetical protein
LASRHVHVVKRRSGKVAIVHVDALFHAMQLHMKDLGER